MFNSPTELKIEEYVEISFNKLYMTVKVQKMPYLITYSPSNMDTWALLNV